MCQPCQLGKHVRQPFYASNTSVEQPFDIIHSDIWTSPVPSVSGIRYYLLFLDHFSQFIWVYPLHRKSDTLSKFIHFSTYVQTQFHCKIKSLQCDNGGEYVNRAFKTYIDEMGTSFRFSCPYTSQQNRKAERMLRTINNLIRTLLIQASMPHNFWVEALHTATHILNILTSSAIENQVPYTKLFNKEAQYSHLRTFGCLCYPNLLPRTAHKLESRSTPCVLLGYPTDHRGYRCLELSTQRIILSRHVTFDESVFPFSEKSLSTENTSEPLLIPPPSISSPLSNTDEHHSAPPTPMVQQILLPPPTNLQAIPSSHPMQTRSKSGISKP